MKYIQIAMIIVMLLMILNIVINNKKITFEQRCYMMMVVIMGIVCTETEFDVITKTLNIISIINCIIIWMTEQSLSLKFKMLYFLICAIGLINIALS